MKLLPVDSLSERADGFPEPLLGSLYNAAQVTRSYRNKRDSSAGEVRLQRVTTARSTAGPTNTPSSLWTEWGETWRGHLAGWAAFDSNRNLWIKMVALGFYEAEKIIRF